MKDSIYISVLKAIAESATVKDEMRLLGPSILEMIGMGRRTLDEGGKIVLFGNGGSAADAQHIAAEFIGLPVLALTTNSSTITAVANDTDYRYVFQEQVKGICHGGDLAIGMSTSGNSRNVIHGLSAAKAKKAATIALTGLPGGTLGLASFVDLCIKIPSNNTPRIQEGHILIGHIFAKELMRK